MGPGCVRVEAIHLRLGIGDSFGEQAYELLRTFDAIEWIAQLTALHRRHELSVAAGDSKLVCGGRRDEELQGIRHAGAAW